MKSNAPANDHDDIDRFGQIITNALESVTHGHRCVSVTSLFTVNFHPCPGNESKSYIRVVPCHEIWCV